MQHLLFASTLAVFSLVVAAEPGDSRPSIDATDLAVFTRVYNGYERTKTADKLYAPETYTFGIGGRLDGTMVDPTIDKLSFMEIAKMIAPALESQNYIASFDAKQTKLLVVVSWGTTAGSQERGGDRVDRHFSEAYKAMQLNKFPEARTLGGGSLLPAQPGSPESRLEQKLLENAADAPLDQVVLQNALTNRIDRHNAGILGYAEDLCLSDGQLIMYWHRGDLLNDVQYNRYFVILNVYDFQEMLLHDRKKLLWTTRFSIRQRGNSFQDRLESMSRQAAKYFGKPTKSIVRNMLPSVKVEIGEPKVLGYEEKK